MSRLQDLFETVYSVASSATTKTVYAGVASESPAIGSYVVFNITAVDSFQYMSKNRGIDKHLVTFDVWERSPSDCGDIMDRLWDAFEGSISFDTMNHVATYRTIYEAPTIEAVEQNGQYVWHGLIGFEISVEADY